MLICSVYTKTLFVAQICDMFYDLFTLVLSVLDVVTDVLIAIQYYNDGEMVFFGLCLGIFAIASIAYTVLFLMMYADPWKDWQIAILFFVILPVSPLVPIFIWITSFKFECVNNMLDYCNFRKPRFDVGRKVKDPLKVRSHLPAVVTSNFHRHSTSSSLLTYCTCSV